MYLLLAKYDFVYLSNHTKKIIGIFNTHDKAKEKQLELCPHKMCNDKKGYFMNRDSRLTTWIIKIPTSETGILRQSIDIHKAYEPT